MCVLKVDSKGQAWRAGVRAGATIYSVGGHPVTDLDGAAQALELARTQGLETCELVCLVEEVNSWLKL